MAVSKRNTASSHAQELLQTIARVALYARVSTCNGQDPEMQLSDLREYASRRWTVTTEYVDQGVSGSKESRPQLNQLMTDAHRRKFDAVLVHEQTRGTCATGEADGKLWRNLCLCSRFRRSHEHARCARAHPRLPVCPEAGDAGRHSCSPQPFAGSGQLDRCG